MCGVGRALDERVRAVECDRSCDPGKSCLGIDVIPRGCSIRSVLCIRCTNV